jgi:hypothetical protein
MRKLLSISFILCSLLAASCNDRPSENRSRNFAEKEQRSRQGELSESRQIQFDNQSSLRLDIEYNGGYLTIERDDAGLLAEIKLEFDREENRPDIDFDSSSAAPTLRIRSPRRHDHSISFDKFRDNDWRLKLSPKIPIDFRIDAGAIDGKLDLTGLRVAELTLNVGAGELDLDFRAPNSERPDLRINSGAAETEAAGLCNANFRRLDFNGGVGASKLFFDGEWKNDARVDMNLGVGKNVILLARHIGAKVNAPSSFLSPIRLHGFDKRGRVHYSENYDQASGHLDFDIKMGVGHTSIDWIE